MNNMFQGCCSLENLPDISIWNTKNVEDISYIFSCCCSLTVLPDISIWNTKKMNQMKNVFERCINLILLPNIDEWQAKKNNKVLYNYFPNSHSTSSNPLNIPTSSQNESKDNFISVKNDNEEINKTKYTEIYFLKSIYKDNLDNCNDEMYDKFYV